MWQLRPRHCSDGALVALVDDELDLHERTVARRHITDCGRCSVRLRRHLDASVALIGLLAVDLPATASVSVDRRHLSPGVAGAGILIASFGAVVAAGIVVHRLRHHSVAALSDGSS